MFKRLHGSEEDHPTVAACLHRLATLLEQIDDRRGALEKYTESLAMKRRIYGAGKDHREIASTLHRIGNCRQSLGQWELALREYQASIDMRRRLSPGKDHAGIAFSQHDSATVYVALGNVADAVVLFQAALAMRKRIYGSTPKSSIAESAEELGKAFSLLREWDAAANTFGHAVLQYTLLRDSGDGSQKSSSNLKIAEILQHVAVVDEALGKLDEAVEHCTQSYRLIAEIHGRDHEDSVAVKLMLARFHKLQGRTIPKVTSLTSL
jgi:tetratricopeptide (TPR) repeat protein